jgi:hypothetical protein
MAALYTGHRSRTDGSHLDAAGGVAVLCATMAATAGTVRHWQGWVVYLALAEMCGRPPASAPVCPVQAPWMVTASTAGAGGKWKIIFLTLQSEYDTIHLFIRESRSREGRTDGHYQSADTLLPQAAPAFDHARALHTARVKA